MELTKKREVKEVVTIMRLENYMVKICLKCDMKAFFIYLLGFYMEASWHAQQWVLKIVQKKQKKNPMGTRHAPSEEVLKKWTSNIIIYGQSFLQIELEEIFLF